MADPAHFDVTINTWTEIIAPVSAESNAMFQCQSTGRYQWCISTATPSASADGFSCEDQEPSLIKLENGEGLYAKGIRGTGTMKFVTQVWAL